MEYRIPYSGKLSREKSFANFTQFCSYYISLRNLEAWRLFERQKRATTKVFSTKIVFFHQSAKVFSLESFPLYSDTTELWYDDYVMSALIIRVDILSSIVPGSHIHVAVHSSAHK